MEAAAPLPRICGPAGDAMVRALSLLRGAAAAAPSLSAAAGRCVVLRALPAVDSELRAALLGARVVVTQSRAVAQCALAMGVERVLEVRLAWGMLQPRPRPRPQPQPQPQPGGAAG